MTFDEYIQERKTWDAEFTVGYDSGYALYEQLFKAKMAGQVTTLKVVLAPHQTGYLGFLAGSPPIQACGVTLAEARANLAQEVVWMLDPEYVQVEGTATAEGSQSQETFVILTSSVGDLVKQEATNDLPKRKRGALVQVG